MESTSYRCYALLFTYNSVVVRALIDSIVIILGRFNEVYYAVYIIVSSPLCPAVLSRFLHYITFQDDITQPMNRTGGGSLRQYHSQIYLGSVVAAV